MGLCVCCLYNLEVLLPIGCVMIGTIAWILALIACYIPMPSAPCDIYGRAVLCLDVLVDYVLCFHPQCAVGYIHVSFLDMLVAHDWLFAVFPIPCLEEVTTLLSLARSPSASQNMHHQANTKQQQKTTHTKETPKKGGNHPKPLSITGEELTYGGAGTREFVHTFT